MHLQVLQEDLTKALATAIRFTSTRSTLPILSNFKLKASKTKLIIEATNLEMSINTAIGGNITEEGSVTVPAKAFQEIVSNLNQGQISLVLDKEQLKLENADFHADIATTPSNDFPTIPETIDPKKSFTLPSQILTQALSKVLYSASLDETRPILTGVLFIFTDSKLNLVSSDGFRLSKKEIDLQKPIQNKSIVVPRTALLELIKLSASSTEFTFEIKDSDNQLVIKTQDAIISTRLIDGNFPNFEKIIPTASTTTLTLDARDLVKGVKLASVFAREGNVIKFAINETNIEITSETDKVGSQKGIVEANVEGSPVVISFNYKFVEDFLNITEGDSLVLKLTDGMSAAIFEDPKDKTFLHLIMPVKIQS